MRLPGSSEGTPTSTRRPRRPRSSPSRTASAASEHTVSKSGGISSPASVAQQRTARVDSLAAEHCAQLEKETEFVEDAITTKLLKVAEQLIHIDVKNVHGHAVVENYMAQDDKT